MENTNFTFEQLPNIIGQMQAEMRLIHEKLEQLLEKQEVQNPDLVDINEIIRLTKKSRATIYRMTSKGEIPHVKIGNALKFNRKEIIEWMCSPQNTSAPKGKKTNRKTEDIDDYLHSRTNSQSNYLLSKVKNKERKNEQA